MEGAWAIIMLYDHHHGRDFTATQMRSSFTVLTAENLPDYEVLFDESRWADAEFARLSLAENPKLTSYSFTPRAAFPTRE